MASDLTSTRFKYIVKLNGIQDPVSDVIVKESDLLGQNFLSKTQLVTIKFENPDKKPLNLFVKAMSDDEAHIKLVEGGKIFVKESTFFSKYVPAAQDFCKSKGQENLIGSLFPRCYFADEKMVVLENLVLDRGYKMLERDVPHDFETAKFALRSIAKQHAISRACIKHAGGAEIFFKRFPTLDFETFAATWAVEMFGGMIENAITRNLEILEKTSVEDKEEAIEFFQATQSSGFDHFLSTLANTPEDEKFLVLNHGDYHNNNMMFKTDEQGKPTDHILIDLQVTRYGSPCLDLHCYLSLTVETSVRRTHLRDLLSVYLDTLKKTSEQLGYPFDITIDELERNYHHKRLFGFWYSILLDNRLIYKVLKQMAPEDFPDMDKKIQAFTMKYLQEHPEEYNRQVKELINVFKEYRPFDI